MSKQGCRQPHKQEKREGYGSEREHTDYMERENTIGLRKNLI